MKTFVLHVYIYIPVCIIPAQSKLCKMKIFLCLELTEEKSINTMGCFRITAVIYMLGMKQ